MDILIRRVRRQLAAARRRSGGGRPHYPEELKAEVLVAASALYDSGCSHQAVARELDINPVTLSNWQRRAEELDDAEDAMMLPVDVMHDVDDVDGEHRAPVVYGPAGVRVEGLDVAGVAELLRRLG
jgi:transposase-like protein